MYEVSVCSSPKFDRGNREIDFTNYAKQWPKSSGISESFLKLLASTGLRYFFLMLLSKRPILAGLRF